MQGQRADGATGVIDLGDGWSDEDEVILPAKPGLGWRRRMALAAAVLAVLVGGAAAARPQGAGVHQLALRAAVVSSIALIGSDTAAVQSREVITGWDLASGAMRWQVPVGREIYAFFGIADLVVVSRSTGAPTEQTGEEQQPP